MRALRLLATFACARALLAGHRGLRHRCGAPRLAAAAPAESEFPRLVDPTSRKAQRVTPTDDELLAIARRVGVDAVGPLEAVATRGAAKGGRRGGKSEITVEVRASVRQSCCTTGAPVSAEIATTATFPLLAAAAADGDDDPSFGDDEDEDEDDDAVALSADGRVDVGELALQLLSLEIDPYPRATAATTEPVASIGDRSDFEEGVFEFPAPPP